MGRGAVAVALLMVGGSAWAADGSIRGTVKLGGVGGDVHEVVVYVPDFDRPESDPVGGTIVQKNKAYVPDVLPIVKGQKVHFDNEDPYLHNVFSSSRAAGASGMDLGKYKGPKSKDWTFHRTGIVDVYCDIHEQMAATVLVLPNSAFAQPKADGTFHIDHVPAGPHVLYAWARHGQKVSVQVDVKPGQAIDVGTLQVVTRPGDDSHHKDKYGESYDRHAKNYGD